MNRKLTDAQDNERELKIQHASNVSQSVKEKENEMINLARLEREEQAIASQKRINELETKMDGEKKQHILLLDAKDKVIQENSKPKFKCSNILDERIKILEIEARQNNSGGNEQLESIKAELDSIHRENIIKLTKEKEALQEELRVVNDKLQVCLFYFINID